MGLPALLFTQDQHNRLDAVGRLRNERQRENYGDVLHQHAR